MKHSLSLILTGAGLLGAALAHAQIAPRITSVLMVSITSPSDGQAFTLPTNITLSALPSNSDGNILKVEFFQGTNSVGASTNSPYSLIWTNPPDGTYSLTAVATDDLGASATSAPVNITVTGFLLQDLGNPANAGVSTPAPGGFDLKAGGADMGGRRH